MALLEQGCVSHNYLWFYRYAMEACLKMRDPEGVERFARAALSYTADEPLPWVDLLVARARALAALSVNGENVEALELLGGLRTQVMEAGFQAIVSAMGALLN